MSNTLDREVASLPSTAHVVVVGAGQIGRPLAAHLHAEGHGVTLVSRRVPSGLPAGLRHVSLDATNTDALVSLLCEVGASAVVVAANPDVYSAEVWTRTLFPLQRAVVSACHVTGARLVALENLYMHGLEPCLGPDTPIRPTAKKGEVRAALTRELEQAARDGVRVVRLRAPDFYGHGCSSAVVGEEAIGNVERGGVAVLPGNPDLVHAFSHRDDVVEALARLALEADVGDHEARVYLAPSIHATPREVLDLYAKKARGEHARARIVAIPRFVMRALGVFVPFLRELAEMAYQWTSPYRVDDAAFRKQFGVEPRALAA